MKMEIEVGEYIRTNQGIIGKIKRIELDKIDKSLKWYVFDKKRPDMNIIDEIYINKPYIVKHNKIISEIVEVGDYVNAKLIHKIDKGPNYCYLYYGNCKTFVDYQIKSIVTHEQFESIEYKVEEDKIKADLLEKGAEE